MAKMIFGILVNPAIDVSGHVPDILLNEKNYVFQQRIDPGGNALNALRIASRLGAKTQLLGFAGGAEGDRFLELIAHEKIKFNFVGIRDETRINITVTNDRDHQQTRFTFPGPSVSPGEFKKLMVKIGKLNAPGLAVIGGSLPRGLTAADYTKIVEKCFARHLGVIVDVPVAPLKIILRRCSQRLLLIKPNLHEFEGLCGKRLRSNPQIIKEAKKLLPKVAMVCVSLGKKGVIVVVANGALFFRAPKILTRGSVGAGDSMVGAIAAGFATAQIVSAEELDQCTPQKILDIVCLGVAAGAATASTEGTQLGSAKAILRLRKRIWHALC